MNGLSRIRAQAVKRGMKWRDGREKRAQGRVHEAWDRSSRAVDGIARFPSASEAPWTLTLESSTNTRKSSKEFDAECSSRSYRVAEFDSSWLTDLPRSLALPLSQKNVTFVSSRRRVLAPSCRRGHCTHSKELQCGRKVPRGDDRWQCISVVHRSLIDSISRYGAETSLMYTKRNKVKDRLILSTVQKLRIKKNLKKSCSSTTSLHMCSWEWKMK